MKVAIAIDSFKGCMNTQTAGYICKKGLLKYHNLKEDDVIVYGVADGGEGTSEVLAHAFNAKKITTKVHAPQGDIIDATYYLSDDGVAIIEMAAAAGLDKVINKDPLHSNTYGLGELIADALNRGTTNFIIGIGGSATNDAGIGMMAALGIKFLDKDNNLLNPVPANFNKIKTIDESKSKIKIDKKTGLLSYNNNLIHFNVACDVNNPLCGENGATYIYGPQKGVKETELNTLDENIKKYAILLNAIDDMKKSGAGAAGGLGFAFMHFMNASLKPGIDIVLNTIDIEKDIEQCDLVITGEGSFDEQSLKGKVVYGVAGLAKKYNKRVIVLCGKNGFKDKIYTKYGINDVYQITPDDMPLNIAMKSDVATKNIINTIKEMNLY